MSSQSLRLHRYQPYTERLWKSTPAHLPARDGDGRSHGVDNDGRDTNGDVEGYDDCDDGEENESEHEDDNNNNSLKLW